MQMYIYLHEVVLYCAKGAYQTSYFTIKHMAGNYKTIGYDIPGDLNLVTITFSFMH